MIYFTKLAFLCCSAAREEEDKMNEKNIVRIKDIYSGKPDARDEATLGGDSFLKSYVMPPNFDLNGLLYGDKCLITGYKGTGKTALLLFLANEFKKIDEITRTSFILFKSDFDNRKRDEWAKTMTVDREGFLSLPDFSAMWRWHLFLQIVEDNEAYSGQLFVADEAWEKFSSLVLSLVPKGQKKRSHIGGGKIVFGIPLLGGLINPQMEIALENSEIASTNFFDLIDEMTDTFLTLTRTETPYYLFLDELEAFYGDTEIFQRDLRLIRDLILEAKAMNMLFYQAGMNKTKIVCAVRSEIVNSINRYIESKEVNKVVDGFDCPIIWDYNTTASFKHPIMEILLKRIALTEEQCGAVPETGEPVEKRWFPERVNGSDPVSYILNHNWSKPRDIVRLISAAQDSLHFEATSFTQAVFESCLPKYARNSLAELREELRALYSAQDIDDIFNCFTGFVDTFSLDQLREQVATYFPHTVLATRTLDVLSDLYRLGIIGNVNPALHRYRWQYRGDDRIILTGDWLITIHRGLRKALSTTEYKAAAKNAKTPADAAVPFGLSANPGLVGSSVTLTDISTAPNGIKGVFDGNVGTVSRRRLGSLPPAMFCGGTLSVRVLGLNPNGGSYELEPTINPPMPSQEFTLSQLHFTANRGIRGIFGTPPATRVGTISPKRWASLGIGEDISEIALRCHVVGKNQVGESYAMEPVEEDAVRIVPSTAPAASSAPIDAPDFDAVYELRNLARNTNGGITGVFGDKNWVGTVSKLRLAAAEITSFENLTVLHVRVDKKNPMGESYAMSLIAEDEE